MVVEDDPQSELARIGDNLVENLQAAQSLQVGVEIVSDAVWHIGGVEDRVRERDTHGVKAELLPLIHHLLLVPGPQPLDPVVTPLTIQAVSPRDFSPVSRYFPDLVCPGVAEI